MQKLFLKASSEDSLRLGLLTRRTMEQKNIEEDYNKLAQKFGAKPISSVKNLPKIDAFEDNLIISHRDFDDYLKNLKAGKNQKFHFITII